MSKSQEPIGPIAVLRAPIPTEPLITFSLSVLGGLTGNTTFPSPDPTLAVFAADIAALQAAQTAALNKGKGAAQARNAKRKKVREDLNHLRDYVQSIIEMLSPSAAAAAIVSAFMSLKVTTSRSKAQLAAKNTGIPGNVLLDAKSVAPSATYYWEFSVDQKTWQRAPETMKGKTTITGLTSATTYYFRFRALTRKGPVDYSQIVSLLVH